MTIDPKLTERRSFLQLLEQPEQLSEWPEADIILCLRQIEQERQGGTRASQELDYVETLLLTALGEKRMGKPGGEALAEEWLWRACELTPSHQPAARQLGKLLLEKLKRHSFVSDFPVIRETDNGATRKRLVEQLLAQIDREQNSTQNWYQVLDMLGKLSPHMPPAEQEKIVQMLDLYRERERLLNQLLMIAEKYAESLKGMFYSSEMLAELQALIRRLALQQQRKENLLSDSAQTTAEMEVQPTALQELQQLIGLEEIKERVQQLYHFYRYQQLRQEKGFQLRDPLPLHLVLMGNPGTGKTTLARLSARLYHELGLLERPEVIEADRSQLVGAFVGQTEERTMEMIKRAAGGVLFIDEAYSLKRADSHGSDYGQVAIDTLVSAMTSEQWAGKFVVILAGYPEEMRHFLLANPGLRSRFPETGHFLLPDYSTNELITIAEQVAERNDYSLTDSAKKALKQRIDQERVDATFGNARTVTNIVLDAIFAKGRLLDRDSPLHLDDFTLLYPEDVQKQPFAQQAEQSAEQQLAQLIGLEPIKRELEKVRGFLLVQQERVNRGLPAVPIELHAVFTGNPGTGKTTVAHLYAQTLRECGYLKRGHLVIASRADLVGGYVGQTAVQTRRKIREALGGVLFVDEAYALATGGELDFGREAITTMVDEMTRHKENLVIVLAGYPREMERLLQVNPGLASRFKKYFLFPDYTPAQLAAMFAAKLAGLGYQLAEGVLEQLQQQFELGAKQGWLDGNGRLVSNLVQEAIQNQALRLAETPFEQLSTDYLQQVIWQDLASLFPAESQTNSTEQEQAR
ncbi:AAA family ATPase [Brevibacillus fulvus]|uniref:SpoVK/Ycf46/Vps4 family AAA+-type ATPase n=1 Tax=Brevibacillus fulvus TaxID=1125967 RepID=A0A938XZI9_9BACL|nr:AAA family ATPase [Brevibacillus fulvus]MBM7590458.1 SpoVK/Ycf46/Vps4 family AAA+-type ATPase [Brevibacillus fulvus]